ncbi:iron ABC transporter permease [Paenibacillus flagellatus]|uniref:Iron ABC transporter permease n=2 Tax=Paenibacillus flagellatus TaxID=2211139 RepID=A0A2V5K8G6_9BACL|nr:iron ABC transporter permease [Paenibacillus flagellatus]
MRNGYRTTAGWRSAVILVFLVLAVCGMLLGFTVGAVDVPLSEVVRVAWGETNTEHYPILWNIRFPRTIAAALAGIGLSLSGALLQGVMRNPMADPHIIGVSSGAGLLGIAMLLVFPSHGHLLVPAAFVGAMAAAFLIYALAWDKGVSPMRIILSGVAVSALLNSAISGLFTFYSDRVEGAVSFMVGSLAAKSWAHVDTLLPYTAAGAALAWMAAQRMNVLMLGDATARSLGLPVEGYRLFFTAVGTLLAASSVSVVGLLGFVGLIVPHAARLLVGNDYRVLLPCSALLGVIVMTACDTLARVAFAPVELPVGIVTGIIGAPFFLYLLRRKARL